MKKPTHPKPQRIVQATKREAETLTRKVAECWRKIETSWWELGRLVDLCIQRRVPAALEMNARDWMEKYLPGSTSKAWRALRISRALKGVPQTRVRQLTEGNAFNLARLPEKMRKDKQWVSRAIDTPNSQFEEEVTSALEKKGVPGARQEFITLRLSLPRDVYNQVEAAVQKMARIFEFDLEAVPGRRIMVWERIAMLVNGINEETLKQAVEGGE